jgi:hypothetical protein
VGPPASARGRATAPIPERTIDSVTERNARNRCRYSITVWYSSRGTHAPKHVGQSGHPSPEPVARTTPPQAISSTVETVVATATVRNARFIG